MLRSFIPAGRNDAKSDISPPPIQHIICQILRLTSGIFQKAVRGVSLEPKTKWWQKASQALRASPIAGDDDWQVVSQDTTTSAHRRRSENWQCGATSSFNLSFDDWHVLFLQRRILSFVMKYVNCQKDSKFDGVETPRGGIMLSLSHPSSSPRASDKKELILCYFGSLDRGIFIEQRRVEI